MSEARGKLSLTISNVSLSQYVVIYRRKVSSKAVFYVFLSTNPFIVYTIFVIVSFKFFTVKCF